MGGSVGPFVPDNQTSLIYVTTFNKLVPKKESACLEKGYFYSPLVHNTHYIFFGIIYWQPYRFYDSKLYSYLCGNWYHSKQMVTIGKMRKTLSQKQINNFIFNFEFVWRNEFQM